MGSYKLQAKASLAGFEPATCCLEGSRSIQTELQGHIYYKM